MSNQLAHCTFVVNASLKTSLKRVSEAMDSLPESTKLNYGTILSYSIKRNDGIEDLIELSNNQLKFTFLSTSFDYYLKAISMSKFLALLAFLSNNYSINVDSLYPYLQEILLHSFSIPEPPNQKEENMKIQIHQLSRANISLSASISELQINIKNLKAEGNLQRQALLEISRSLMLASNSDILLFAKKLQDLGVSSQSINLVINIIKNDKNEN
ncbi:MAG: hypothetical protein QXD11_00080 [Candidatus Micrarchaeaceae archaeon]